MQPDEPGGLGEQVDIEADGDPDALPEHEETVETPDELGGTGGEQAGGAG